MGLTLYFLFRDGSILVWSCGESRVIEPQLKIEETLTCANIFDFQNNQNGNGNGSAYGDGGLDAEMQGIFFVSAEGYGFHQIKYHNKESIFLM